MQKNEHRLKSVLPKEKAPTEESGRSFLQKKVYQTVIPLSSPKVRILDLLQGKELAGGGAGKKFENSLFHLPVLELIGGLGRR